MEYAKYRKHPRVYNKSQETASERIVDISAGAAVGILAVTLVKGMFWGYLLGRRLR